MKREEIFNKIINGLYSCKDEYGEGLNVHFNSDQIKDFANTLTSFFPDNLEYKLTLLETELFDNIPDKEELLFNLFRFNILSVYTNLFNTFKFHEKNGIFLFSSQAASLENFSCSRCLRTTP